ncbi:MAG: HAMP domain-containing sensor histidine kinase, partial [Candidatus Geothermincolales bacterium]
MPVERRISRILSLFSLVAIPPLFILISLPSRMSVDRSGLYAVAASLAVLALLHYAVRTRFPREGKTLSGMPELLGGVIALAVMSALAGFFGGGPRSPFSGMAFFCALLAGTSLDSDWSLFAWAFVSASSALAHALSGRLGWELAIGHPAWYWVGTILGTAIRRQLLEAENERKALSFRVDGYLEREKAKSERISAVSHELRTPLTSMQGFAEILAERNPGREKGEEFARIISENARRMLRLVRGLLDLSRAESVAPAEKERVDLVRLAREVCDTFSLSREDVSVRLEHPGHAPWVLADPHLLRLALGNLVSNAVKFSPPGEEVRVKVYFTERHACVAVEDRGPGIPREELPFIFHSFRRGSGARQADPHGAGLGLAVVKGVVEAHGGNVRVESEPGEGSRFAIFLPISGEAPGRATPRPHGQDESGRPKGPSIVNAYAWALPLFLTAYPGLLALGGEFGSFHPVKALILPALSLLALRVFARPAPGHGKAPEVIGPLSLYLILALWNAFAAKGLAFTFPLFLSAAAFTGWRGEERNSMSTAILAPSAYLLSSLPLALRDPMYVATGTCFLILVPLFISLARREARIIREQAAHLREAAREAMERDR